MLLEVIDNVNLQQKASIILLETGRVGYTYFQTKGASRCWQGTEAWTTGQTM